MKHLEEEAAALIKRLLGEVPFLAVEGIEREARLAAGERPDLLVRIASGGQRYRLVCEFKAQGQPRTARQAAAQLRYYCDRIGKNAYGVFLAPYLSPASRQICIEHGIGFADLAGNCRLVFDSVFIERETAAKPVAERRELRSLFTPKSAQVLRTMLRDPARPWKVTDLAEKAGVSIGHVSNVRSALLEREWAQAGPDGFYISDPDSLLDEWRDDYRGPPGKRLAFYTTLHGNALAAAVRGALLEAGAPGNAMLASYSAAHWLAPYARVPTEYFYADSEGLRALEHALRLSSIAKGENVIVWRLDDDGLFRDAVEPAAGIRCTGPVQTYLDLSIAGERGREAADHLRAERLSWHR
ncbi:MAG: type IV toxin-antitoxin system AbiEi family antitoxin [Rhodoplanes sp.]